MKLLLNNKELAHFLCSLINHFEIARGMVKYDRSESWNQLKTIKVAIRQHRRWLRKMRNSGEAEQVEEANSAKWSWGKWPGKFEKVLYRELSTYVGKIWEIMDRRQAQYFNLIHNNIDRIISALGEQHVLRLYKQSQFK